MPLFIFRFCFFYTNIERCYHTDNRTQFYGIVWS